MVAYVAKFNVFSFGELVIPGGAKVYGVQSNAGWTRVSWAGKTFDVPSDSLRAPQTPAPSLR